MCRTPSLAAASCLALVVVAALAPLAAGEAEADPDPYHHYPGLTYPWYHYHYRYTHFCSFLIKRPHLLARLYGLLVYYHTHCYGTYSHYPHLGYGLGW